MDDREKVDQAIAADMAKWGMSHIIVMPECPAKVADPVVAMVYGAMAYPSLQAGILAATDLVAGQPGPWTLTDAGRAEQAAAVVARLGGAVDAVADIVGACRVAQRTLLDYWTEHATHLPPALRHEVEDLESRLVAFVNHHPDGLPDPARATAPEPDAATSIDDTMAEASAEWSATDWRDRLRSRGITEADALRALRRKAANASMVQPSRLADVTGNVSLARFMLAITAEPTS